MFPASVEIDAQQILLTGGQTIRTVIVLAVRHVTAKVVFAKVLFASIALWATTCRVAFALRTCASVAMEGVPKVEELQLHAVVVSRMFLWHFMAMAGCYSV